MYRLDLHTHSCLSPDGSLTTADYQQMLDCGRLDYIAITDHNQVDFALKTQKKLGNQIIVGEEIDTGEGEIIGLYLQKKIEPLLGAKKTVAQIRRQDGLVYIPHPFETVRRGMQPVVLGKIIDEVDIIEVHNGRAYFNNQSKQAREWSKTYSLSGAASSDAHGLRGWGKTYSVVAQRPTRQNLAKQLSKAKYGLGFVGPIGILYPIINRLKYRLNK